MVDRVLLGNYPGGCDLLVSKLGVDVKTAPPGQLLLGRGTSILQILAQGNNLLNTPPYINPGATYAIIMPSALAGLTDILVWADLYSEGPGIGGNQEYKLGGPNDGSVRLVNGTLFVYSGLNELLGFQNNRVYLPAYLYCRWAVFRFKY